MKGFLPVHSLIDAPDKERVFHRDQLALALKGVHGFGCGMCGKQFSSLNQSWECVIHDTLKLTSLPIKNMNGHGECYFQCLLCAKYYINIQDAALCLDHDLQYTKLPLVLSEHLNTLSINILNGQKTTKRDVLYSRHASFQPKKPFSSKAKKTFLPDQSQLKDLEQTEQLQLEEEKNKQENPSVVSLTPVEEIKIPATEIENKKDHDIIHLKKSSGEKELDINRILNLEDSTAEMKQEENLNKNLTTKTLLPRRGDQKPFKRQDAWYVCTVCSEKFFTKAEAVEHFEQHPLEESL